MNKTYIYHWLLSLFLWLLAVAGVKAQSLEYWFDNYVNPIPISLSNGHADIDAKSLKIGAHTLHLRVKSGGDYSPVYSSTFFKFKQGSSKIEYWFDGDVDNLATMAIDAEKETVQMIDLDLSDSQKFPLGIHQLSMRIAAHGGNYSPVYNTLVMRMPAGTEGSVLEYWFDDDRSNPGTIPVDVKSGVLQKLDLDLSSLENFPYGLHRLNMRVAAYGNQYSPVYSTMVMRWPNGPFNYLTYWLDDDYDPNNLKRIKTKGANAVEGYFETNLNFRDAAPGMHRLHYRVSRNAVDFGPVHEVPILITRKYVKTEGESVVLVKSYWADNRHTSLTPIANHPTALTWKHTLDPNDYSVGQYSFRVRFQNSAELWSEENITYFYKETANGRLVAGIMPDDETTGIKDLSQSEVVACECDNSTIYLDCQSPKLGKTGVIIVCDMMGRVIAQQNVSNVDGIHAAMNVENHTRQLVIVRLVSGDVHFSKKLVIR